jgi:RNA polymerase sigma factor FliA
MTNAATATLDRSLEEQIREHIPLVGHLVRETLSRVPGHVSRDDLTSAGLLALVTAAKAYDPAHGVPFTRFVAIRIKGALVDALRGLDWATRSVRQRARQVEKVRQELTGALGRTPTASEVAESLGVAVDELDAVEDDVRRAVVLSLQGFATGTAEDMVTESAAGPEDLLLMRERIGYLHNAIEALPERLRLVVTRYFLEERPMAEVAAELGVTESRVSQLRSEALTLLRDGLNAHLNPGAVGAPSRPDGCVARRRAAYYAEIGNQGTLKSRLAMTTELGMPVRHAA